MREVPRGLDEPFLLADVDGGELRTFPGFALGTNRIEPGAVFRTHRHDHGEELVIVTGGSVLVSIEETETVLVAGDSIAIARGTVHGLRNASAEEGATVSFVKVPYVEGDTVWL